MNRFITILILILATGFVAKTQNIFPEAFLDCDTEQFALESDTTNARISGQVLIDVITKDFSRKTRNSISGRLALQIIVYMDGRSCLLSMENDTNISSDKLKIKPAIDNELKWEVPTKVVSAIVMLHFDKNDIRVQRFGMNTKRGGWHEIYDPEIE